MKINGGSFNMMKALNESAKDKLEVKKQVLIESNKVTITEDEDKYKDMFINYCDGKVKDLGTMKVKNPEYIDEDDEEYIDMKIAFIVPEFREAKPGYFVFPEYEGYYVVDKEGNIVFDADYYPIESSLFELNFTNIDTEYYNLLIEEWENFDMDYFFKENKSNLEEKVTYTNKDGEDYKELTKTEYLNLGKKYGEKVNDYEVKEQNGKFYILKSDYEKLTEAYFDDRVKAIKKSLKKKDKRLSDKSAETSAKKIAGSMKESNLTEGDYDYVKDKRYIVIALEGLKEDLLKLPNVTKVEFDTSLYADNIPGPITLVFYDIKESGSEYFKAKDLLLKRILAVMEINGVNIEKEETEDNDTYFYFVAYSTNWNKEPIEETSMEEIRQDSADKGLLEPEAVNEDDEDSQIWNKVEKIVNSADNEIAPDQSAEYDYDEHIKFVIYRDFEYEDIFAVYTYVDGEVQEDLDTGDVHLEDLDKTLVNIVKKLQNKESATITEATVSKDLHEVKSQGNIYMLQDNDKYIVGENYDSKEKLIENAEIYNNKEEADKDYLNRCGIKID